MKNEYFMSVLTHYTGKYSLFMQHFTEVLDMRFESSHQACG